MKFYLIRDSYFSQIEASALLGFRLGYTCFGLAAWPPRSKRRPWWVPHVLLTVLSHTGQCDRVRVFGLQVGRRRVGWTTRGDAPPAAV